jgi:hypothetical protein
MTPLTADPLLANLLLGVAFGLLLVAPAWRIFRRTGLAAPWSLLVFVPAVGPLAAVAVLAFVPWPALSGGDGETP